MATSGSLINGEEMRRVLSRGETQTQIPRPESRDAAQYRPPVPVPTERPPPEPVEPVEGADEAVALPGKE